jgi:hypothetical protein
MSVGKIQMLDGLVSTHCAQNCHYIKCRQSDTRGAPSHLDNPLDVHLSQPENEKRPLLVVVEVPAARKVLSDDFRQLILGQDLVDAVLLTPGANVVKLFTAVI